jgi:hypothetical protein
MRLVQTHHSLYLLQSQCQTLMFRFQLSSQNQSQQKYQSQSQKFQSQSRKCQNQSLSQIQ